MPQDYTEDLLVEQPAMGLFDELGWTPVWAKDEILGPDGTLGRESKAEVVIFPRLRQALRKLNKQLPESALSAAIDGLTRDRFSMEPEAANRELYELLKQGVLVSLPNDSPREDSRNRRPLPPPPLGQNPSRQEEGGERNERVKVVDWNRPLENDLLAVSQMKITGPLYSCIPDVILFVNGLPLVVLEFKKPGVPDKVAFDENLTSYKHPLNGVPALFWYNALLITSNGTQSHVGSLTADWDRFFEWKRIERENEPKTVSLETMLRGTCEPSRLLDLVENFTLFSEHKAGVVKVLGQNHQVLGVNNAIRVSMGVRGIVSDSMCRGLSILGSGSSPEPPTPAPPSSRAQSSRQEGGDFEAGRGGVFWQTQGSGKSFSMVFYAQKILRKIPGNWTFVIVTDRAELDDQIAKTFKACGAVSDSESKECHAQSGAHLRELLKGNHRYVFTLIQKFTTDEMLCDRPDVVVLADEAHRSQYDTLAVNMRAALPKALFLAFTGTPLIAGEERTREVFGDYVSVYDFQQSVEDGATVPLFYENRTPELQLVNPDLNEDIYDVIEDAGLDEESERRLERVLGRQYHLITRDDRLETVAKDVVRHFLGRGLLGDGQPGKAMVVSIDKATALKMYAKVTKEWSEELRSVNGKLAKLQLKAEDTTVLRERKRVLETTDMAVVVSPGQNEVEQMKAIGLDIVQHRQRMNAEALDEKFKDTKDPLRLVFVCAMWLTGFDAPTCSTIYLDKPMRNHTLMQTIARANRVYPGKQSGMIVDYANVFLSLEKALAIYGVGSGGSRPVREKAKLVEDLEAAIADATALCVAQGVSLDGIEKIQAGSIARLQAVGDAVDALIAPDSLRKDFLAREQLVRALYTAVKPDPAVVTYASRVACLGVVAAEIKSRLNPSPVDLSAVMGSISQLLDQSITGVTMKAAETRKVDLSKIDFKALAERFSKSEHKNTEIEVLKAAIRAQLDKLILLNKSRIDFLDKFEQLIESYNTGAANIEDLFRQLVEFTKGLSEEEQRHVRENVSEEELVVFDILTRPAPDLSDIERREVKKVAREMLAMLKSLLVIDWRTRSSSRSQVKLTIEDMLDSGLPRAYSPELYREKCTAVFDHFFDAYPDERSSVYASAG